jgi:hypothetical protein
VSTVLVLSEQCATCVFRPGNPMHLARGRLKDLVDSNLAAGALLVCHDTLSYGAHPEAGEAMCRGFWDRYRERTNVWRVMERLSAAFGKPWWEEVPPPGG